MPEIPTHQGDNVLRHYNPSCIGVLQQRSDMLQRHANIARGGCELRCMTLALLAWPRSSMAVAADAHASRGAK